MDIASKPATATFQFAGKATPLPLNEVRLSHFEHSEPVRGFRWHPRQRHFPGWYWSATTRRLVAYESRHERLRLMLADMDPSVCDIRSQPFELRGPSKTETSRGHFPDFALIEESGTVRIVNVKTPDAYEREGVREVLDWARQQLEPCGFVVEVWTGVPKGVEVNVEFLAGYRNSALFDDTEIKVGCELIRDGQRIVEAEEELRNAGVREPRQILMHLIWTGFVVCDLEEPLGTETRLEVV